MNSIVSSSSNQAQTMSSREIASLTGKNHYDVMGDIRDIMDKSEKGNFLFEVKSVSYSIEGQARTYPEYLLPRRETEILITGYDVIRRAKVIDRWMELEVKLQQPALPATYLEALEKLLETEKEKIAISHERDHAIKTKAEISDKKTATAMATASVLSRKVKTLESKLQDVGNYQSLIAAQLPQRVETEINDNAQTWRVLVKMSKDMNLPPKKVIDARYGEVNTYHVEVINKFIEEYL